MSLFDAYIFVDWNAAKSLGPPQPAPDNVWIGEQIPHQNYQVEKYCCSRNECTEHLGDILKKHIREGLRVLIGFDFSYGYPKGLPTIYEYDGGPQSWWLIWEELSNKIQDAQNNNNNRFQVANDLNAMIGGLPPGPFWGHPHGQNWANLWPTSPGFPFRTANGISLDRLRLVDSRLPGVQETWKLFGRGAVGSQALVGIPRLYYLRNLKGLSQHSKVWPFETGFTQVPVPNQGPFILHAEIWPGVVRQETDKLLSMEPQLIRDRAQVRAMCSWAAQLDENNELGRLFGRPTALSDTQMQDCIEEEGWILGAV